MYVATERETSDNTEATRFSQCAHDQRRRLEAEDCNSIRCAQLISGGRRRIRPCPLHCLAHARPTMCCIRLVYFVLFRTLNVYEYFSTTKFSHMFRIIIYTIWGAYEIKTVRNNNELNIFNAKYNQITVYVILGETVVLSEIILTNVTSYSINSDMMENFLRIPLEHCNVFLHDCLFVHLQARCSASDSYCRG